MFASHPLVRGPLPVRGSERARRVYAPPTPPPHLLGPVGVPNQNADIPPPPPAVYSDRINAPPVFRVSAARGLLGSNQDSRSSSRSAGGATSSSGVNRLTPPSSPPPGYIVPPHRSLSRRAGRFARVVSRGGRGQGRQGRELRSLYRALAEFLGSVDVIELSVAMLGLHGMALMDRLEALSELEG